MSESVDPKVREHVPWPYNGSLSTMDAHGGWVASAIDLLRFVSAIDGPYHDDIIDHTTVELMTSRPPYERGRCGAASAGWCAISVGASRTGGTPAPSLGPTGW